MVWINPVPPEQAHKSVQATYQHLNEPFGHIPQFYTMMAHRPDVLNQFVPFYTTVLRGGTIDLF